MGSALCVAVCYKRNAACFYISLALCVIALVTDVLDGYFARKLKIASVRGRHWDSLGDKAFYIATIIAFNGQGFLGPLVSWALIVREVAIYITRILFIEKLSKIDQIWPLTKCHGYLMYLTIILGLFQMYAELNGLSIKIYPYIQASAYAALAFGVGSMIQFLKLE